MNRAPHRLLRWLPAVAWAAVIFALSAQPGSRLPGGWSVEAHLGFYAVLGGLVWVALGGRASGTRGILLAILLASAYGVTDEFHQSFVPQRTPDVLDWVADTIGATLGVLATRWVLGLVESHRSKRDVLEPRPISPRDRDEDSN